MAILLKDYIENRTELSMPKKLVLSILDFNKTDILIGGQAIWAWASYYNLIPAKHSVSMDIDFLGQMESVLNLKTKTKGKDFYIDKKQISSLIGQIIILEGENYYYNIDVLHKVYGVNKQQVIDSAVVLNYGSCSFKIIHPIMLFKSKLSNLAGLEEKRNSTGIEQLNLSLKIVNSFISELISSNKEAQALKTIEKILPIMNSSMGKWAVFLDIDLLQAFPFNLITNESFNKIRKPQIIKMLSEISPIGSNHSYEEREKIKNNIKIK